jgi:hypothetical protein
MKRKGKRKRKWEVKEIATWRQRSLRERQPQGQPPETGGGREKRIWEGKISGEGSSF